MHAEIVYAFVSACLRVCVSVCALYERFGASAAQCCLYVFRNLRNMDLFEGLTNGNACRDPGSIPGPPDLQFDALRTQLSRRCSSSYDMLSTSVKEP